MACSDFETLFAAQMTGINRNNGRLRVSLSFATKSQFRSKTPFSQPLRNAFRNCQINVTVLRSGTRVPNSPSQLRNTLRNETFVAKSGLYHFAGRFAAAKWMLLCCEVAKAQISQQKSHSAGYFAIAKVNLAHKCHFAAQWYSFGSCEMHCEVVKPDFATKVPFRRVFRNCEGEFGTRVPLRSTVTFISQLRNALRSCCENGILLRNWRFVAKLKLTLRLPFFLFIPVI